MKIIYFEPRLQNSRIQVRASSQTEGLERGWKQRAKPGERRFFCLSPHTPLRARKACAFQWVALKKRKNKSWYKQEIKHNPEAQQ